LQDRGSPIDCELRLAIEDDEHLFGGVMEMMPDASTRHDLAPVHEIEVDVHCGRRNQELASHIPGAVVGTAARVLAGVSVADSSR
jgi:hypothetical protein